MIPSKDLLLSRDDFRALVFERDGYKCVICGDKAQDAHHIMERRLFTNGGYFKDNGASLCGKCHIEAEKTLLPPHLLRTRAGIKNIVLPEHLYKDAIYDKWGNIMLPNGTRIKGELFYDESVQKILKAGNVLSLFSKYIKYPRTYHLPWSSLGKDDRMMPDASSFLGKNVVVTLKMDGENTTMYNDYIHARSIDSGSHPSRNRVKDIWAQMSYLLDDNMRICGENLYAKHSVSYKNLPSYFMMFSIWIDSKCLSWKETEEYAEILGLQLVPVIYKGKFDRDAINHAFRKYELDNEGYVVRIADEFDYGNFKQCVGKYVRPYFRTILNDSHGHWISKKIEVNKLSDEYSEFGNLQ